MFTCWYQSAVTHTCGPSLVFPSQCEVRNLSRPMVVTQPLSSLAPKLLMPPAGQRTKRLSVSPVASSDPEQSGESHLSGHFPMLLLNCLTSRHTLLSPGSVVQTGTLMGVVFAAFVMGVSLMAGLWCIYHHTGNEISFLLSLKTYIH